MSTLTISREKEDIVQEQVLQAALQLFQKYGLHKVTMDDIAKAVGKSRSALYYYYKNRDEVFDAVMESAIGQMLDEVTQAIAQAATVEDKLRSFCLTRLKISKERRLAFSAMEAGMDADEMSRYTKAKMVLRRHILDGEGALVKQILAFGAASGAIRKPEPKERDLLIFVLLGGLHGIKREMQLTDDFRKAVPAVDILVRMFLSGLKT